MGTKSLVQQQAETLLSRHPSLTEFIRDIFVPSISESLPFLPIRAFRIAPVDTAPAGPRHTFFSSGSTNAQRASHAFSPAGLSRYASDTCAGFASFLQRINISTNTPLLSLVPTPDVWKTSSLAAMIDMFSQGGFLVHDCSPERDPRSLFDALDALSSEAAIIFGTSFHHIWMAKLARTGGARPHFSGKRLVLIDTGGTKGKTEVFSQEDLLREMQATYGSHVEIIFASEYGMCELASQAWSAEHPHRGTFACNPTLTPLAINAEGTQVLPHGELGFLAFIDSNNTDSFSCLITEDLGCTLSHNSFQLIGRAPDATIKGCSLNVRDDFMASSQVDPKRTPPGSLADITPPAGMTGDLATRLLARLPETVWPQPLREELRSSLMGWDQATVIAQRDGKLQPGGHLEIVASANIPITWLYPAAMSRLLGYSEVILTLPTLRTDDPISGNVIEQIRTLAEALAPELSPLRIILREKGALESGLATSDTLIVFGSDTTCASFAKRYQQSVKRLLCFGDVANSADGNSASPILAAQQASAWQGRGCLTPLAIFLEGLSPQETVAARHPKFFSKFLQEFEEKMALLRANSSPLYRFAHQHDRWEIEACLQNFGGNTRLHVQPHTLVVDLTGLTPETLSTLSLPWRSAGAGLIFLLGERRNYSELDWMKQDDVFPNIVSPHSQKNWARWLSDESPEPKVTS